MGLDHAFLAWWRASDLYTLLAGLSPLAAISRDLFVFVLPRRILCVPTYPRGLLFTAEI